MSPNPARLAAPSSCCPIVSMIGPGEKLFFLLTDPSMPSRPSDSDPSAAPAPPDPAAPGAPRPSFFRIFFSIMLPMFLRSEEHTSELQSLMRISYAVFCLKKKNNKTCHDTYKIKYRRHTHER